jgi:hypothetical protein
MKLIDIIEKEVKCDVKNCTNTNKQGMVYCFDDLILCGPCLQFLRTGKKCYSQLERNGKLVFTFIS